MKDLTMTNRENNTAQGQRKFRSKSASEILAHISMIAFVAIAFVSLSACNDDTIVDPVIVDVAPPAPQGVYTVRGNNSVTIHWLAVEANDFDRYRVYRGDDSLDGTVFDLVGESIIESLVDDPATSLLSPVLNGIRYYYAVTAVDLAGNESAQSAEYGGATPRVEGISLLSTMNDNAAQSGFDLSSASVVPFDNLLADFWIDRDLSGILFINVDTIGLTSADFGDIQDMGYTEDFDVIGAAPIPPTSNGWSALRFYEVLDGHTYIIWTQDDRYAKVRILSQTATTVTFEYAYQNGAARDGSGGEPELAPQVGPESGSQKQITATKIDRSSGAHRTDISQRPKNIGLSGASQ